MQNHLAVPQPVKPLSEIFWDAVKQAVPKWYEGLLKEYSPKIYPTFKAARELEPSLLPEDKPILDAFIALTAVVGAADIGSGVARKMRLSNPPYAKPQKKLKRRPHA